ncbi:MAG: hypothetical protein IT275_02270 [Chitinophagales bacterium]|nr:hypothetical protein [Chitinophagales bacterium]
MKISFQYINDDNGNAKTVQLPIAEWEKVLLYLKKSEQGLKLKSDLKIALKQVESLMKSKKKETLTDFLHEL